MKAERVVLITGAAGGFCVLTDLRNMDYSVA